MNERTKRNQGYIINFLWKNDMFVNDHDWITTGNGSVAVCPRLCRVRKLGHTANLPFAVCQ